MTGMYPFNRKQLSRRIAREMGCSEDEVLRVLDLLEKEARDAIANGGSLEGTEFLHAYLAMIDEEKLSKSDKQTDSEKTKWTGK